MPTKITYLDENFQETERKNAKFAEIVSETEPDENGEFDTLTTTVPYNSAHGPISADEGETQE